jgi:diketogulonate reductase-like aldo/keto reductase
MRLGMSHRPFGRAGDVPVIGQGTWKMEHDGRADAIAALRRGMDLGMTHIDTAELYGDGAVESLVGEAIAGRRDGLFLVTKVLPWNASYEGTLRACESSLKRLGTDRLDSYLLHGPPRFASAPREPQPLEETIAAFEKLERDGKIRSWGVSNFDVGDLDQALAIAGPGRIASNQVLYNIEQRSAENAVLRWCIEHGVALVAFSPFRSGGFPAASTPGGRALTEVAERHGATPHQVVLAFLARNPSVLVIPKAARVHHVEDVAAAGSLVLSQEDVRQLDAAFPRPPPGPLQTL